MMIAVGHLQGSNGDPHEDAHSVVGEGRVRVVYRPGQWYDDDAAVSYSLLEHSDGQSTLRRYTDMSTLVEVYGPPTDRDGHYANTGMERR